MHKPIYSSEQHKSIVDVYVTTCKQFTEDISTQSRYRNYLEVIDLIMEYHNGYGEGVRESNSVATNGFFAGIETKTNSAVIRAYKVVLDQMLQEVMGRLDTLEPTND